MSKKSYQKALEAVAALRREDLERLRGVIDTLLSEGYLDAGPAGHVEMKYITRDGKRYGPYKYLRIREGGKLRSIYLGKASQE